MIRCIGCLIFIQLVFCSPLNAEETELRPNNNARAFNANGEQQSTIIPPVISAPAGAPLFLVKPKVQMKSRPTRKPDPYNSAGQNPITEVPQFPELGPYLKYLQEQILRHWTPHKGYEEKRVVLMFKLRQDGSTSNIRLSRSSGVTVVDDAALNAVKEASPFRPAPRVLGNSSDVEFTFDANLAKGIGHKPN